MSQGDLFSYQQENTERKRLFLFDSMGFIFRSFYAIQAPLKDKEGRPTNAVYGFARALLKVLREYEPEYVSAVFDAPGKTFREEMYAKYKANRPEPPKELTIQIPMAIHLVESLQIPHIFIEGYEADDILATLSEKAKNENYEVVLVSGDKDIMQLICSDIQMYDPYKGENGKWYSEKDVWERFGTDPQHVPDALALIGDSADNVPGVPGIGDKTAKKLMEKYCSLENLYKHLDEISGKIKKSLEDHKEDVFSFRKLLTLRKDAPIGFSIKDLKRKPINEEILREELHNLSFLSLIRELQLTSSEHKKQMEINKQPFVVINKKDDLEHFLNKIESEDCFSFDLATHNGGILNSDVVGIAISLKEKRNYFIPFKNLRDEKSDLHYAEYQKAIRSIFQNENLKKLGFDLKKSIQLLHKYDIELQRIEMDVMLASYLVDTNVNNHSLEALAGRFLGDYRLLQEDTSHSSQQENDDRNVKINKSAQRSEIIYLLYPILQEKLREQSLDTLYREIEVPLISVLARMEENGITMDLNVFQALKEEISSRIQLLEQEIYKTADMQFNINSPKQLQSVLFDKLGLKPLRKTKTGASTDIEVLEELASQHPLPALIIEYRTLQKLLNTYVEALPKLVNPNTGKIHTTFNQAVVATGRLSSSDPNLQNIPIRTDYGKRIREGFIASSPDWTLISADYSQIELRILAHLSEDPTLCSAFYNDRDIHRETAAQIFEIPFDKVTDEHRRQAKAINFGVIYGMTPYGLSKAVGFSTSEASQFIESYFKRFSKVKQWLDQTIEEARKQGYITTLFNRRRYISDLNSSNQVVRRSAERMAVNTPVQGSAADIIKKAMIEVDHFLQDVGARLLLQVHDELLIEVPRKQAKDVAYQVKSIMEKVVTLRVPLKVDIGLGNNWAEAH
ncbi:MAG TPA: DNA polymerase I [Candidatus Hydrogenedens sp.]|nr:DNA polymerase I [Candidatus Hydrogenedens sp.]HOL18827.1 DNA polymerase I [Candidatus Hydrogenedens sp.]HPP59295.1 DNA polymerase I [Candidatus Hydrogenedens sp.]